MKCHACATRESCGEIECQPGDPCAIHEGLWKLVSLCQECFKRLDPDLWTCQTHYEDLNPVVPYDELPELPKAEE